MSRWLLCGALALVLAAAALIGVVRMQPRPFGEWKEFAIGPASGWSLTIHPGVVEADGASLATLVAWVHGFQTTRLIGPAALQSRYTIRAVAPDKDLDLLRTLLRRELESRFRLETHVEKRPFDVWVLTASAHPVLAASEHAEPTTSTFERNAKLTGATMGSVASALQTILGKPVADETGIGGKYDLEFAWGEEVERSLVVAMREKFGLVLTEGNRELDALLVDRVEPDFPLTVCDALGRLTQRASPAFRRGVAHAAMGR